MTKQNKQDTFKEKIERNPFFSIASAIVGTLIASATVSFFIIEYLQSEKNFRIQNLSSTIKDNKSEIHNHKDTYKSLKEENSILVIENKELKKHSNNCPIRASNSLNLIEAQLQESIDENNKLKSELKKCISGFSKAQITENELKSSEITKPIEYKKDGLVFSIDDCSGTNSVTCTLFIVNESIDSEVELSLPRRTSTPFGSTDKNGKSYKINSIYLVGNEGDGRNITKRISQGMRVQIKLNFENIDSEINEFSFVEFKYKHSKVLPSSNGRIKISTDKYHITKFRNVPIQQTTM